MKTMNFLVTGVGGQGALLVSNILADVGVRAGYDVKKSEVHGMAQRGGSVTSTVRWGKVVYSPLIGQGEADYLLALEKLEALRYMSMLRPGGTAVVGDMGIPPLSVSSGDDVYPDDEEVRRVLSQVTDDYHFIPSVHLAEELGNARAHNVVLLGTLSTFLGDVPTDVWLQSIRERVPKRFVELNERAFHAGREARSSKGS
jgi:indolepyruvate ferredoxin oxidoreductase beta subunit